MGIQDYDHWPGPSVSDKEYGAHQWIDISHATHSMKGIQPIGAILDELNNFTWKSLESAEFSFDIDTMQHEKVESFFAALFPELAPAKPPVLDEPTPQERLAGQSRHGPRRGSTYDARGRRRW